MAEDNEIKVIDDYLKYQSLFVEGIERFYDLGAMMNYLLKDYPELHSILYKNLYQKTFRKFKKVMAYGKYGDEHAYDDYL